VKEKTCVRLPLLYSKETTHPNHASQKNKKHMFPVSDIDRIHLSINDGVLTKENLNEMVKRLVSGEDGAKVASDFEETFGVSQASTKGIGIVKNMLLEMEPPSIICDQTTVVNELKNFAEMQPNKEELMKEIEIFNNFSLKDKHRARMKSRGYQSFFSNTEMDNILSKSNTFVPSLNGFQNSMNMKRKITETQLARIEKKIGEGKIFEHVNYLIELSKEKLLSPFIRKAELTVQLLFVSGRRTCEICCGTSVFKPGSTEMSAIFFGNAKQSIKLEKKDGFEIPLLVPYSIFSKGYARLRELQGFANLTPKEVNAQMSTNLKYHTNKFNVSYPDLNPHELRAAYAAICYKLFRYEDIGIPMPGFVQRVLGHSTPGGTSVYSTFLVGEVDPIGDLRLRPILGFDESVLTKRKLSEMQEEEDYSVDEEVVTKQLAKEVHDLRVKIIKIENQRKEDMRKIEELQKMIEKLISSNS